MNACAVRKSFFGRDKSYMRYHDNDGCNLRQIDSTWQFHILIDAVAILFFF